MDCFGSFWTVSIPLSVQIWTILQHFLTLLSKTYWFTLYFFKFIGDICKLSFMVFSGLALPSKWPHSIIGKEEEYWIPISSEQRKKKWWCVRDLDTTLFLPHKIWGSGNSLVLWTPELLCCCGAAEARSKVGIKDTFTRLSLFNLQ